MTTVVWDGSTVAADTRCAVWLDGVEQTHGVEFNSLYMAKNMFWRGDELECAACVGAELLLNRFLKLMEQRVNLKMITSLDSYSNEIATLMEHVPPMAGIHAHVLMICKKELHHVTFNNIGLPTAFISTVVYDRKSRILFGDARGDLFSTKLLQVFPAVSVIFDLMTRSKHAGGNIIYWKSGMTKVSRITQNTWKFKWVEKFTQLLHWAISSKKK